MTSSEIEADLAAVPLPRRKLDLLWVGPSILEQLKTVAALPAATAPNVLTLGDDESGNDATIKAVIESVTTRTVTAEDIDWAIGVDRIAGEAEDLAAADDLLGAIAKFRDALKQAPGCDNYLMSLATCHFNLGLRREALRYLERAYQINPKNARILRNLKGMREALGAAAPEPSPSPATVPPPSGTAPEAEGWTTFDHPEGLFSISYPSGWRHVSPVSDGAALSLRSEDDSALIEVLCMTGGTGLKPLLDIVVEGLVKYAAFERGMTKGRVRVNRRFAFGGHDGCAEVLVSFDDEAGRDTAIDYVVTGRGSHALYVALKTRMSTLAANRATFAQVVGTLKTPWLRAIEPPSLAKLSGGRGAIFVGLIVAAALLAYWLTR